MNCTELMVRFDKHDLKLVALEGERFITIRYLALALETKLSSMKKLVREMRDRGELREGVHFRYTPFETNGGNQLTTLITYRGVIRVAMRSDSPRAVRFRDWAEEVLYALMSNAGTDPQLLRVLIEQGLKEIGSANHKAAQRACDLILSLRGKDPVLIPMTFELGSKTNGYLTAMEWMRRYYPAYVFPAMNAGGRFERYVAHRFLADRHRWPEHDGTSRIYAWIYSERYDREFLEGCLQAYLKEEVPRILRQDCVGERKAITAGKEE